MGTEPEESALGLLEWVDLYSAIGDIDRALAYAQRVAAVGFPARRFRGRRTRRS
jgi:hypothetical protein